MQYFVNNVPVTFPMLEPLLTTELAKSKDFTVILRCDSGLTIQDLVTVLEIGNKLKVKMVLATKAPNGSNG